ncbi:NAD-dependent epimerase/dehydratase family protein [Bacillus gobiensis]|uniref:NAD-dependent epimerase/dehydratase family protein n=1 Tax=Bacillus gobiensis TaxID=1441095 RepID=UPI003D219FCC
MVQKNNLLITGASGFTGRHAVSHFLKSGFAVTALLRHKSLTLKGVQMEWCDLTKQEEVVNLIKKIKPDYLLHLAGQNHVGNSWVDPIQSLEANAMATAYLLHALRQANPSCKVVVAGSALQFDPHRISTLHHPYSLSKTIQTQIAQAWAALYELPIVIARPSNLIGPGPSTGVCSVIAQKIVNMEHKRETYVLDVNNLSVCRDFLDVRDAVRAYETLLLKGISGHIYDICSGENRSLAEVLNVYKCISSVNFSIRQEDNKQVEPPKETKPVQIMDLGWKPIIPFNESLIDILTYFREDM